MILICGIPNSGKTTYSAHFDDVIHFDDVKGGSRRHQRIIEMVRDNPHVCVEGVYESAADRAELVRASSARNVCIHMDTPLDVCVDREIKGRQRSVRLVRWCAEEFETPTYDEGWDEIVTIGDSE